MAKLLTSLTWVTVLLLCSTSQSLTQETSPFYNTATTVSDIDRTMPDSPGGPRLLGYGIASVATADEPTGAIAPSANEPCNLGSNVQNRDDCATLVELIQVGSFRSKHEAEQEAARFAQEHATTLGALIPGVKKVVIGPKNEVYFRLRYSGFRGQNAPTQICSHLANKGEQCLPLQP